MAVPEGHGRCYDHGGDRICAGEGCTTILSRYNRGPLCCLCAGREVPMKPKVEGGSDRERVLELLQRQGDVPVARRAAADELDLTERCVAQHVSRLKAEHDIEVDGSDGLVTYSYRSPKSAPGGPPAPAPDPIREPPAEEAATPVPGTPAGAPPSAGEELESLTLHVSPDPELEVIERCVAAFEASRVELDRASCERIFDYLMRRYT
jgi:hypothetical protein